MNDMCKGIDYGLAHVKFLEKDKINSLRKAGSAQFDSHFFLSRKGEEDLNWWYENTRVRRRAIRGVGPSTFLTTDASKTGWGAIFEGQRTGDRWSPSEAELHINVLKIMAIELGLHIFLREARNFQLVIITDNTTSVAYINHMGGTKSSDCNLVAHRIWGWCETRNIWSGKCGNGP